MPTHRSRPARPSLKETVAARSRDIAGAARARSHDPFAETRPSGGAGTPRRPAAPAWLASAVKLLPTPVRDVLREALGPTEPAEDLAPQREHLRQQREDLRHRETALDAAREDFARAQRLHDEARHELEAREREAERLLAEARRAAGESAVERLVPLPQLRWDPEMSPRPLRGVARLAANLRRYGQLTPVVARADASGALHLVTGYRRMAALAQAGATHVRVRVVPNLDETTAAALYVAENCLPDGISSKAVSNLAERLEDSAPAALRDVLARVQADDLEVTEEVYLEDMAEEARHHLAEGAAWVAALRPHWKDLEAADRQPLVDLLTYFARVQARLGARP